ncbi:MAG: uroporphyrinogen-III synthase [Alistipes sp.]|jgi:uroporphyrinogen-III synthase|nr:uroporphyrinogen-III synthase [Alistipes sp.]
MSRIKNLLVSQPAPSVVEKSPFFELIQKLNLSINYTPFIHIEGVGAKEFRGQRVEILDHTAIIFTNRTTIDHFFRICEETRVEVPESMKYICQTEAIALYLQKYIVYRKRKISFADGSFTGLMDLILKHKDERFLLTLSEPHKPEIPATLEKLKVRFSRAILARTVSSDLSGLRLGDFQMVVMYSPAEVKSFVEQFGGESPEEAAKAAGLASIDELPLIATFGEGTARKAMDSGLKVSVMAPTPEAPSMARAIEIFITDTNAGRSVAPVAVGKDDRQARQAEEFVKAHQVKEIRKNKTKKKPAAGKK